MATRQYLVFIIAAFFTLGILFFFGKISLFPQGSIVGFSETFVELFAAASVLRNWRVWGIGPKAGGALFCFFAFLGMADFFYVLFFFILGDGTDNVWVAILTKGPYSAAFLSGVLTFWFATATKARTSQFFSPAFFGGAFLTAPIAARYILLPYFQHISLFQNPVIGFLEGLDIILLTVMFWAAISGFFRSRSLFWTVFSTGIVTLVLGDWAIRLETLLAGHTQFTLYEFQWAAGVYACAIPIFLTRRRMEELPAFSLDSLLCSYKLVSVVLGMVRFFLFASRNLQFHR